MTLAPIGLSTYSRLDHLKQTVDALQGNTLAPQSELYIFSDAPRPGDEEKVREVRNFIKTINGFKRVEIVERERNNRVYNNRQGMRMLLDRYGKMIFLEEDIVSAPTYLEFMNFALDAYKDNPRIMSIAGYRPPIAIPSDYPYDVFLLPRFDPWGFGIWKDRFDLIEMKIPKRVVQEIYLKPKNLLQFSRGGIDLLPFVLNNYFQYGDGLDVKIPAHQFVLHMFTVYPVRHLVDNVGLDGTGEHTKIKPWYRVNITHEAADEYQLPTEMEPDPRIWRDFYRFRSGSLWNRFRQLGWIVLILLKKALRFPPKWADNQ